MQKQVSSPGQLIVVELGAEWPSALRGEPAASARRVFAQEESESPSAFARRVGEQLDGLLARGVSLGTAFIACSERADDAARVARSELARAAASALALGCGGHLQLTASDRNEGRSRAGLTALERELVSEWRGAAVETKLCFNGEARTDASLPPDVGRSERATADRSGGKRGGGLGKSSARRVA